MIDSLSRYRRVHFVGIGGIGMSALARYLLAQGVEVSGSDASHGDQIEALSALGARVHIGHDARYLDGADLVVVVTAAPEDDPEVVEARSRAIPVVKRSEFLAAIVNPRRGIAVAGTHGKTTTSALIGWILTSAGLDPTVLIGGISRDLDSNARVGRSDVVVAEADEFHGSFLKLRPSLAVITNVEAEHLDFYGNETRLRAAFAEFADNVVDAVVLCADDPFLRSIQTRAEIVTYGLGRGDWQITDVRDESNKTSFVVTRSARSDRFSTQLAGVHNARNATAAIAVAWLLDVPMESIREAVASFRGTARRFERKGEAGGVLVLDDYAHHPTEIRVSLDAARRRFNRPIRLVFQPHTYSRTKAFLEDFACAFGAADAVYLLDIYAARERDALGISGRDLADAAQRGHPHVVYTGDADITVEAITRDARPGDLVMTMGAGDVYLLGPRILEALG